MSTSHFSGPVSSGAGFVDTGTTTNVLNKLSIDSGTKTATADAGAATLNKLQGAITSEALTTAAGSDYTLTLTNSAIAAADMVIPEVENGTNTTEGLSVQRVQPDAGSCVIKIRNTHASSALNGTIVIKYLVIKA